jgi:hypothetical protein
LAGGYWPVLTPSRQKVAVSMRALIQRINRKLYADDEALKTARSEGMRQQLGDYYIVDWRINGVMHHDVDPVVLARELGVLKPYERLAD